MIDSSKPLKVWEKNGELFVYTNRRIKVSESEQSTRGAKNVAKKTTKKSEN